MSPSLSSPTEAAHEQIALRELESIAQELARRRREHGLDYFVPNAPQLSALTATARIVAYCGGNRAGKSHCGAAWLSAHLTHHYPSCPCHGEWFRADRRFTGPLKVVIVVTEFQKIETVIHPKLMALLPADWVADQKQVSGYLRRLRGKDGSTIEVLSGEQDQLAFEGQDWDLAWIDEPMSLAKFNAVLRGLTDRSGLMLLTFTPTVEPWMKERIIDAADGDDIAVVQADTYANLEDIHGYPIQTRAAIHFFERTLSEDERPTRIHGQFFHLRGMVYKEWLPGVHDRAFSYAYPDPVIAVLDPHTRKPHWVIWAFINRLDQLFVDRELVFEGTLRDLGKAILSTEQLAGYKMRARLIDPNYGRTPMITTGRTVIDELRQPPFPVSFLEADDAKDAGMLKVKSLLQFDRTKPMTFTNMPLLYFHTTRALRTIRSLRNYQHEEWRGKLKGERDPKEDTRPKDDDGADCVRYLAMYNATFDKLQRRAEQTALAEVAY